MWLIAQIGVATLFFIFFANIWFGSYTWIVLKFKHNKFSIQYKEYYIL